ncbi:MAG: hypothetical protein WBZ29_06135 [Methanocella sp.]
MVGKRLFAAVSASLLIIAAVLLIAHFSQPAAPGNNQTQRIDWGYKAHEIVGHDQEFRSIAGDNPKKITGIIIEGECAYMYYPIEDEIFNVTVDFKNNSVESIAVENDEKRLAWLNGLNLTPVVVPLYNTGSKSLS